MVEYAQTISVKIHKKPVAALAASGGMRGNWVAETVAGGTATSHCSVGMFEFFTMCIYYLFKRSSFQGRSFPTRRF